jgi:hypothetical protein
MIFSPTTKQLFADDGTLIKKFSCPRSVKWADLPEIEGATFRNCSSCRKKIFDTANCTDRQVIELVQNDPAACLKIDPNQDNIKILIKYDF